MPNLEEVVDAGLGSACGSRIEGNSVRIEAFVRGKKSLLQAMRKRESFHKSAARWMEMAASELQLRV